MPFFLEITLMIDWRIFILLSRESDCAMPFFFLRSPWWLIGASLSSYHEKATVRYVLDESAPRLGVDHFHKLSCWPFDFFPRKFTVSSKPPSRDNYRKASYPRTQQRDQGAGGTHNPAIRVVVKTTPLPIRPRCRLNLDKKNRLNISKDLVFFFFFFFLRSPQFGRKNRLIFWAKFNAWSHFSGKSLITS